MSKVFLPGCKVKAKFKYQSDKLQAYLEQKEGVQTVGCCKAFCSQVAPTDIAVVICNNCAAIMEESSVVSQIEFVWNIIDNDPEFPFPDYHGERIVVQDCWRAYEKRYVQDAVRSLMRKMNIVPVELPNNYEKSDFCGADLLECILLSELKSTRRNMIFRLIQTYKEIVAFTDGKSLDEIEKAREEGKRPYQKALLAAGSATLVVIIALIMTAVMKLFS